jgi:hypothetical protein
MPHRWICLLFLCLLAPPLGAQERVTKEPVTRAGDAALQRALARVSPDTLSKHLHVLASDEFGGRGAGYPGDERTAAYLARYFADLGLTAVGDTVAGQATHRQAFLFHPRRPPVPWQVLTSYNVVGFLEGSDPALRHEIVVVGGHHDGQGRDGEANMSRLAVDDPERASEIWPSANDNASGTVVVLEIARVLRAAGLRSKRSVLFITFGAEEHGLVGSLHYTANPLFPWERHVAMLNMEMLGRNPARPMNVRGTSTSPAWAEMVRRASAASGMHQVMMATPEITNDTDHYGFAVRGVPAVHYGVGERDDYHRVTDTADRIDYARLAEITRFGVAMLLELANLPERPRYTGDPGRDPGITGTTPTDAEFAALGLGGEQGGIKVTAVAAGLAAHAAGLRAGDLVVAIGEQRLARGAPGLRVLAETITATPVGNALPLSVLRQGQPLEVVLRFESPRSNAPRADGLSVGERRHRTRGAALPAGELLHSIP